MLTEHISSEYVSRRRRLTVLLASERSERAQLCLCSIEISDTYVYIYVCGRTSSYMRMLVVTYCGRG